MPVTPEAVSDLFLQLQSLNRSTKTMIGRQSDRLSLSTLLLLSQVQGLGEVRGSALAELLGVDTSVVSRQLAVLEAAGLTARRPDPHDGRAWLVHITPDGAQRLQDLRSERALLVAQALDDWGDAEVRQLCAQLVRLDEAFQHAINASSTGKVHT
ncbi:MarR family winged helix-turn-helix transcriptional regulator [Kineosporia babensis]|uniref:MarR family transcriptional regulator n=1 Tax=Kineosporia babensis TaxID=499548 RepID=A0A9X1NP76_9ACTN|nr:MarR family transcriptional regulator [Kineosporia babensis]MCD5316683.1 MarR family transcriptional regulator [Kineosporia babensis]